MTIDLMLDLETLGKGPGFAVLSAAFVPFRLNGRPLDRVDDICYPLVAGVNIGDSLANGLKIDQNTLEWWSKQEPEVLKSQFSYSNSINYFIDQIAVYMQDIKQLYTSYTIWASAPKLDFGCLYYMYVAVGRQEEWPFLYSAERCFRTLKNMATTICPDIEKSIVLPFKPNHDPKQDCEVQIYKAQVYYQALRKRKEALSGDYPVETEQEIKPVSTLAKDKEVNDAIAPVGEDQHW